MSILAKKKAWVAIGPLAWGSVGLAGALAAQEAHEIAGAHLGCYFETECYEAEACVGTSYSVDVSTPESLPGPATFLPDTGPVEGGAQNSRGTLHVLGLGPDGTWSLARAPSGEARLSVQYSDPVMVVTYFGRCDAAE
jgi:hypothetical protein